MSPIYEDENTTRERLFELRKRNRCKVCGADLNVFLDPKSRKAFLACWDWPRTHHEGIEREAPPPFEANIPTRRKEMEEEFGEEKSKALAKYISIGTITKAIATEIVETLWGDAPLIEKTKAILLCQTYQLNPLMRHLYLVGYRRRDRDGNYLVDAQGEYVLDWSMQIGIGATRLMAQRKHNYSYLDLTPRKATKSEIDKILGDTADPGTIYGFVHVKDVDTGAEAFGLRGIPKNERIKGTDKGNTHLNMACIRSERLALDRQYPGEMPQGVEVVDERYIEADYRFIDEKEPVEKLLKTTGKASKRGKTTLKQEEKKANGAEGKFGEAAEREELAVETSKADAANFREAESSPKKSDAPAAEPAGPEGFGVDISWLKDALGELKWDANDFFTFRTYLSSHYKIDATGSLEEVISRLTRVQAKEFTTDINNRLSNQSRLF